MSTQWYKKSNLNRKWRQAAKKVTMEGMNDPDVRAVKTSTAPYMSDIAPDMKLVNHWGKPGETGEQDNIHAEPLMEFIEEFNQVSTNVENGESFFAADVDYLIGVADDIFEFIEDDTEKEALIDAVEHLEDLHDMLYGYESFEEQYIVWFHALNALKKVTDKARYVVDIPSPDEMMSLDAELLPDEIEGQIAGQLDYSEYSVASDGEEIDEFYGINVDPDPYDPEGAYVFEDDPYNEPDENVQITEGMMKAWQYRENNYAAKHDLSLRQMISAFDKAYNKIMNANGGWIFGNVLFTGLSSWELDALEEEGLIKRKGNRITLTRQGYEKPHWYRYS